MHQVGHLAEINAGRGGACARDDLCGTGRAAMNGEPHAISDRPVISFGTARPMIVNAVGITSASRPPSRSFKSRNASPYRYSGTGYVVCDVCGPPVAGSIICSQLP